MSIRVSSSIISDHALLKYIEHTYDLRLKSIGRKAVEMGYVMSADYHYLAFILRHEGIDVNAIRRQMVKPEIVSAIGHGARTVVLDNTTYVLDDGKVVAVYVRKTPEFLSRPVRFGDAARNGAHKD